MIEFVGVLILPYPAVNFNAFNAIALNFFAFVVAFQDDALYLFGDVFPCALAEKGSYGIYRTINFSDEIQRLYIGGLRPKPQQCVPVSASLQDGL